MNHKFISRIDGSVIYYSAEGARIFKKTKAYANFKYAGPISDEDKEAEEEAVLKKADKNKKREKEINDFQEDAKTVNKKTAKTTKLGPDELKFMNEKNKASTTEDDFEDDDDDDDDDQEKEKEKGKVIKPKKITAETLAEDAKKQAEQNK